jgi:AcrR family transcriptional regulator
MTTTIEKENARAVLLEAALEEFWSKGYNGTRVDEIIANTSFTKGAFYHHFDSKKALAEAVVREVIGAVMEERWLNPLQEAEDPFAMIIARLNATRDDGEEGIRRGCILNNLAQELSHHDDDFRALLNAQFARWTGGFEAAIAASQARGQVCADIDPAKLAVYIVATYEGGVSLAKAGRCADTINVVLDQLIEYLEGLRTPV